MRSEASGRILIAAVLAVTSYLLYLIFRPFLPGIAWAVVLTVVLRPIYLRLMGWFGGRHWAAAGLVTVLVAALVVVPMTVALVQLAEGLVDGYQWIDERVQTGGPILPDFETIPAVGPALAWLRDRFDLDALDLRGMIISAVNTAGSSVAKGAGQFATNVLGTFLTAAVLLVSLFLMLRRGPELVQELRRLLPLKERDKDEALALLEGVTRSIFLGVFTTAFAQGVLGGIGFAMLGLGHPIMFGAAMMFCALFPGGTALVWAPGAVWLWVGGSPLKAVLLLVWGILVVSSADNFLRPLLIGRGTKIPTTLILVGTIGGVAAWGLLGLFLGPLVITVFQFLLEVARRDLFRTETGAV